nr:immunoglobulin heavy chain junction region [Mus musculus]NSM05221.1 immunoglobulin heavy chain junction region [Mus musculus]NSM05685.1 immunoglobulin heavy chain junction region [Mus musculus]NSM06491.1 immunoglobulin heavy chain junction region [Mus musculus]NSM06647.1 immunoglobulin heavy chain junction region [Mus musculus]
CARGAQDSSGYDFDYW